MLLLSGTVVVPATAMAVSDGVPMAIGPMVRLQALAGRPLPAGAYLAGNTLPSQNMAVDIVLKPSNAAGLTSLIASLYNPRSPIYHHFLTPGEFQLEFGPSSAEKAGVLAWLDKVGLTGSKWIGPAVQVHTTVQKVSSAFGVHVVNVHMQSGRMAYSALGAPLVPVAISSDISAILGLSTVVRLKPALASSEHRTKPFGFHGLASHGASISLRHSSPARSQAEAPSRSPSGTFTPVHEIARKLLPAQDQISSPVPCSSAANYASSYGVWTPNQVGSYYGINSLLASGYDGNRVTVAVYELAAHSASDVAAYESCFGLTNPVSTVAVDGGGTYGGSGTAEADLDIEQVATQAPGANIISYEGPNNSTGEYDTWDAIVQADQAQVISTSWGGCEYDLLGSGLMSATDSLFQQAATQGQSVFAIAGDQGSEGCYSASSSNPATYLNVDFPASDPYVTGVGGTSLQSDGSQPVWNYCQSDESLSCASGNNGVNAGGGGLSVRWSEPSWQDGFNTWYWNPNTNGNYPQCGKYCRGVPDIAANAGAPETFYVNGEWEGYIGTSIAAPLLAGMFADIANTCYGSIGDVNPALYAYAGISGSYGVAFNGVTQGNNDMTGTNGGDYPANPSGGWSPASGLGTPIASGLACPEVTSVQPSEATSGSQVTVTGSNLSLASFYFVTPNDVATKATVVSSSPSTATLVVPAGSGRVVIDAGIPIGYGKYNQSFTYVTSVSDVTGPSPSTSLAGAPGVTYHIGFTTSPTGALAANVGTITLSAHTGTIFPSSASDYMVNATVAASIYGGGTNMVTIVTPVAIASSAPVDVIVDNVTNPPEGTYTLAVSTASDTESVSTPNYTIIPPPPPPAITSIIPDSSPLQGGEVVTVTGADLNGATALYFGTVKATNLMIISQSEVTATIPAGKVPGTVDVTVTTPGGTSSGVGFVYVTSGIRYVPVTPYRIADTRCAEYPLPSSITSAYCSELPAVNRSIPSPGAGNSIIVQVAGVASVSGGDAVPATAQSVVLNITAIASLNAKNGYVTVYPAGTNVAEASSLNFVPGTIMPNLVTATLGEAGAVSVLSSSAGVNIVVDVEGYYEPVTSQPSNLFDPLALPARLLDTRCATYPRPGYCTGENLPVANASIEAPPPQSTISLSVAGLSDSGVPSDATAVSLVVTAARPQSGGYLTVWPDSGSGCGIPPTTSNVNFHKGTASANSAIVETGSTGKICVFNSANTSTNVVVDINGYFSSSGDAFTPSAPTRICDTRALSSSDVASGVSGQCANSGTALGPASGPIAIQVAGIAGIPLTATAVVANVTVVSTTGAGYLTAWAAGSTQPTTSNINWAGGETVPNMVTVTLSSSGAIDVYTSAEANIIIDVVGWYS